MSDQTLRAAIVQDDETGRVLMLGWMDDQALELTHSTRRVHFFSRSRQQLWMKSESSGHELHVSEVLPDCDDDALLVRAHPLGPTCHEESTSCFTPWLWRAILQRERSGDPESYVTSLLARGLGPVVQKVGEEATEVVVAALSESDERLIEESADLWFHLLLVLRSRGLDPAAVEDELLRRRR